MRAHTKTKSFNIPNTYTVFKYDFTCAATLTTPNVSITHILFYQMFIPIFFLLISRNICSAKTRPTGPFVPPLSIELDFEYSSVTATTEASGFID